MANNFFSHIFSGLFRILLLVRLFISGIGSTQNIRHYFSDTRGNVAILFAILAGPILLGTAISIDYSRFSKNYAQLINAADSALLATSLKMSESEGLDDDELQAILEIEFDNYMNANFGSADYGANFDRSIVFNRETRVVSANVSLQQDSVFSSVFESVEFFQNHIFGQKNLSQSQTLSTKLTTIPENYVLDIVMCIDATGSMQSTLTSVQTNASTFDTQLRSELGISANDPRFKVRVRPIYFRDWKDTLYHDYYPWYYRDGLIPASDFYDLDDTADSSNFQSFLNSEYASAGFDYPEAAGACMNEGMRSNWYDVENQTDFPPDENLTLFPILVVWTDNAIQELWRTQQYMSASQPTTYSSFEAQWNNAAIIPQDPKLLILFGPENYTGWSTVKNWSNYEHGGSIWEGNSNAISIIADHIVSALPDTLRLTH